MNLVALLPAVVCLAAFTVPAPDPVFTVQDPRIDEASSMVDLGKGLTVLTNDSGDTGRVFVLDEHGRTVGTTSFGDAVDTEALAPARSAPSADGLAQVWVGDIGDNRAVRPYVVLRKVPVGRGERRVTVPEYRLTYPDGPHDAETLLSDPRTGRLYLITKALTGGTVYAVPEQLDPDRENRLRRIGSVPILATDGAFLSNGRQVLVRGYARADLYAFPGFGLVRSFRLPAEPQGESISVGPGDRVRVTSEGLRQPVLEVALPGASRSSAATPSRADDTPRSSQHDGAMRGRHHGVGSWSVLGAIVVAGLLGLLGLYRARAGGRAGRHSVVRRRRA